MLKYICVNWNTITNQRLVCEERWWLSALDNFVLHRQTDKHTPWDPDRDKKVKSYSVYDFSYFLFICPDKNFSTIVICVNSQQSLAWIWCCKFNFSITISISIFQFSIQFQFQFSISIWCCKCLLNLFTLCQTCYLVWTLKMFIFWYNFKSG